MPTTSGFWNTTIPVLLLRRRHHHHQQSPRPWSLLLLSSSSSHHHAWWYRTMAHSSYQATNTATNATATTTMTRNTPPPNNNNNNNNNKNLLVDVLIVGGGVVGSALARQLQQHLPTLSIGLIERGPSPLRDPTSSGYGTLVQPPLTTKHYHHHHIDHHHPMDRSTKPPSPRSYALSTTSMNILGESTMKRISKRIAYYDTMQIWEEHSPAVLLFTKQDLPQLSVPSPSSNEMDPSYSNGNRSSSSHGSSRSSTTTTHRMQEPFLGAMVEDDMLVSSLWQELISSSSSLQTPIQFWTESVITDIQMPNHNNNNSSQDDHYVHVKIKSNNHNHKKSNNNNKNNTSSTTTSTSDTTTTTIATRVLVGADGAQSSVRNMLGIPMSGFDYGRRAFVTTVRLETTTPASINHPIKEDQEGENDKNDKPVYYQRAYQRFLPHGPLALLPSPVPHYATVVWSTLPDHAKQLVQEPNLDHVMEQINQVLQCGPQRLPSLFGNSSSSSSSSSNSLSFLFGIEKLWETMQYGLSLSTTMMDPKTSFRLPPRVIGIEGPRFALDLSCRQVRQYVYESHSSNMGQSVNNNTNHNNNHYHHRGGRVVLVGDAAHTIHPMAGQGLNIGLLDVQELVQVMVKAHNSGMDLHTFLPDYEQHRLRHVSLALMGVHTLHEIYGIQSPTVLQHVKSFGMHLIQNVPFLKQRLTALAAGTFYGL